MTSLTLIGIDCATRPNLVGLCRALSEGGSTEVQETRIGGTDLEHLLAEWVGVADLALLALDAPLGWPDPMREVLPNHRAGDLLDCPRNEMFRRETDRIVRESIGQRPLDVGADRIARTAHSALERLSRLRHTTGEDLPLCWDRPPAHSSIIEVYPAATRKVIGSVNCWKEAGRDGFSIPQPDGIGDNPHLRDAVCCVLAAHHFLYHDVLEPENVERAKREGWIWVKTP